MEIMHLKSKNFSHALWADTAPQDPKLSFFRGRIKRWGSNHRLWLYWFVCRATSWWGMHCYSFAGSEKNRFWRCRTQSAFLISIKSAKRKQSINRCSSRLNAKENRKHLVHHRFLQSHDAFNHIVLLASQLNAGIKLLHVLRKVPESYERRIKRIFG